MAEDIKKVKLLFRKGTQAELSNLDAGEPGLATDTQNLYVGTGGDSKVQLAKQADLTSLQTKVNNNKSQTDQTLTDHSNKLTQQQSSIEGQYNALQNHEGRIVANEQALPNKVDTTTYNGLKSTVDTLKTNTENSISQLNQDVSALEGTVAQNTSDIEYLKANGGGGGGGSSEDLTELQSEVSTLKSDVSTNKSDISTLKQTTQTQGTAISAAQGDISKNKTDIQTLQATKKEVDDAKGTGTLKEKFDSIEKSQNSEEFEVTTARKVFTLTSGQYVPNSKTLKVYIQGILQSPQDYVQTNSTTVTFKEDVPAGNIVTLEWLQGKLPTQFGHNSTHELGGPDEIDLAKLKNYQEKVVKPIADVYKRSDIFFNMLETTAKGDGATNDTSVFTTLENSFTDKIIELNGKTYLVDSLPTKNKYVNGRFLVGGSYFDASFTINVKSNHGVIALGIGAAKSSPTFPVYSGTDKFYKNIAIGGYALQNSIGSFNNIAIGWNAMDAATSGEFYNIAIGNEALWSVKKTNTSDSFAASRNIAIGMNAMRFNINGHHNVALGRNNLQCSKNGSRNTAIGVNAMAGIAPLDLTGVIADYTKYDSNDTTAIGAEALLNSVGNENTGVGAYAANNLVKATRNVAVGKNALYSLQKDMTVDGNNKIYWSKTGSYVWSGTKITVTMSGHGLQNGNLISLKLTTGSNLKTSEENQYTISNVTTNTFDIVSPLSNNTVGNCSSSWYSDMTANTKTADNNNAIGNYAMENSVSGQNNTAIGTWTLRNIIGEFNSFVGNLSGTNLTSGSFNSALGYGALRAMQDGTTATNLTNVTALGYNTRASGDNQVQLGDANTTTYAFGPVQSRSDKRDKLDIQDTDLGLEFIKKVPIRKFRYNYRDLYEEGDNSKGDKAGKRFHQGVIAQEVKKVMDDLGVDFGGYQDHKVNGGSDVLSIGYEEFIPVSMKAIQELAEKDKLKDQKIEKLESAIASLLERVEKLEGGN
ncbi:tail spike protein [Bacillus phage Mater]|uniref:Tail spike protein n=1 Tax=Bacillus phage Mater TaxID=1540090 RepID=A0A0A0RUQ7_9CAUD|nr:tail spike protein [Bacillus phage Mater]AIW03308.1 tail spike protein [Bacillus phage Mater]